MSPALSVAASLSPGIRQDIGIQVLALPEPVSHIAATHQVSRKFVYQQGAQVQQALDDSFAPSQGDDDVLFHLPVTKNWLYQLILGLVLICHSSYRGVVELFRDLFDMRISIGTVHNRLQELFDFIVCELQQREDEQYPAIRKLRKALRNQRDQLLAFAQGCFILNDSFYELTRTRGFRILTYKLTMAAILQIRCLNLE